MRYGLVERYAVNDGHGVGILCALNYLHGSFALFCGLLHLDTSFAKVHQDLVDRQAVQPGGEGGLATEASNFSKELNEDLLGEVFCLRDVLRHAQAKRVDATIVALVNLLERLHVALGGTLRQLIIGRLCCPCLGSGHVKSA